MEPIQEESEAYDVPKKGDQRPYKLDKFFFERFGATLQSHEKYTLPGTKFFSPDGSQIKPSALVDYVYKTPIEEVSK